ncbi:MAG: sigma-54-dependent Fis family transcriptional regulator [Myxococcales bacterium]|nr:sigma-54-dependent Fis family transcriptional regulator [Myxococcales bacterium]
MSAAGGGRDEQSGEMSTLMSASEVLSGTPRGGERLVLVLVWSRDEPGRVGELLDPFAAGRRCFTVGRSGETGSDGAAPLLLRQLRPTGARETGPFRSARISRRQLCLTIDGVGRLEVERLARSRLLVNDRAVDRAAIAVGDLVEVERRFILLASTRPQGWPSGGGSGDDFAFAAADCGGIVGESTAIWSLRQQIAFIGRRRGHTLVHGPSGSGKELVVRSIHALSERRARPLVARNAATIPEPLIDAELFGNLKNFPNPGMPERSGLFGEADGSTLFLDEIGELPEAMQAHLLRVMDRGEYQRLGEARMRSTDARVIGATNRDLTQLKHDVLARFFHRVAVPGLDARVDDVPLLARHILRGLADEEPELRARYFDGDEPRLSAALARALLRRRYTTHARELVQLLWRSAQTSRGRELEPPPDDVAPASASTPEREPASEPTSGVDIAEIPREAVVDALARCKGVQERAWRELGLRNRYQLRRLLKKFAIPT